MSVNVIEEERVLVCVKMLRVFQRHIGDIKIPLTSKGTEILARMIKQYKSKKKGKSVFYASEKAGTIKGVHK